MSQPDILPIATAPRTADDAKAAGVPPGNPLPDCALALEAEIARLIVTVLHLENKPEDIDPEAPLFGEGLGLDSIDALELALALSRSYGIELKSDDEHNREIFASLRALARFVGENRIRG
jgi:acyl carrier protein